MNLPLNLSVKLPEPDRIADLLRDVAEAEILPRFQRLRSHEMREKAPGDLVTVADERAEAALIPALEALTPGAIALGEEGVAADPSKIRALTGERPVWVIDPVDGTQNFADGVPCFAVIVALVVRGETVWGAIYDPLSGEMTHVERGGGVWRGDVRISVPAVAGELDNLTAYMGPRLRQRVEDRRRAGERGLPEPKTRLRCAGQEYLAFLRGDVHLMRYVGALKPWDHAAGVLMAEEAGGFACLDLAKTGACGPYRPGGETPAGTLLVAPSRAHWETAVTLLTR